MQAAKSRRAEFVTTKKRIGQRALPRARIVMHSVMLITVHASDSRVLTVTN
jgi:hypothetical protein